MGHACGQKKEVVEDDDVVRGGGVEGGGHPLRSPGWMEVMIYSKGIYTSTYIHHPPHPSHP
jgi:hypothetical protein